ncbi:MAG: GIY-YIG nuclease family protein [Candidatus Marinimicrobia bacterium]|nr:GIY-YIG nuclease family protein [Candidatus Neomarinimicrobiota bacterium]MBL7046406.1 GIY-YIG nuclease family protein [Candidatus Neomarinimicrobiota bacterium]
MPFFTYILFSESHDRYYIGHTDRLEERIIEHNSGHTKSTRYGCPFHWLCRINRLPFIAVTDPPAGGISDGFGYY